MSNKDKTVKRHNNTLLRIKRVQEIVAMHYEPGNQAKCYKAVWRNYVFPVYPCCYMTFLSYINTPLGNLNDKPMEDKRQLKLFDDEN